MIWKRTQPNRRETRRINSLNVQLVCTYTLKRCARSTQKTRSKYYISHLLISCRYSNVISDYSRSGSWRWKKCLRDMKLGWKKYARPKMQYIAITRSWRQRHLLFRIEWDSSLRSSTTSKRNSSTSKDREISSKEINWRPRYPQSKHSESRRIVNKRSIGWSHPSTKPWIQ